jgi:Ser/Thr protein kinase RdoA (MazF antagonist)
VPTISTHQEKQLMSFENLMPDCILSAVEAASGIRLTSLIIALPSYINRVYELRAVDGTKLIVKFYRPGRWSHAAIADEHQFTSDCNEAEIPVVPAMTLLNGSSIGDHEDFHFSLFPRRAGRQLDIIGDTDWLRLGSLVARLHLVGEMAPAVNRVTIDPAISTLSDVTFLCKNIVPVAYRDKYHSTAMQLIEISAQRFSGLERIRIHGDCHRGNILDRLDEGLLLIDFDDMAMGPPVQDVWLLLPDRADKVAHEIELFITGYERFRRFDRNGLKCIESLRAMRMIYFLAWCSRQIDDTQFKINFPSWGNNTFWQNEINDLQEQIGYVVNY